MKRLGVTLIVGLAAVGAAALVAARVAGGLGEAARGPAASADSMRAVARVLAEATANGNRGRATLAARKPTRREARWIAKMNSACAARDVRARALSRPATLAEVARFSEAWLRLERRRQLRTRALGAPPGLARAAARIRRLDARRMSSLETLARRARAGDAAGTLAAVSELRTLARSANATVLRAGLTRCAYAGSGLPL